MEKQVQQIENKENETLFSRYFDKRKNDQINEAIQLREKALNNVKQMSKSEIRRFIQGAKQKGLYIISSKQEQLQKQFINASIFGLFPAFLGSLMPFLFRQFYSRSKPKKALVSGSLFLAGYLMMLARPYEAVSSNNMKVAHQIARRWHEMQ